MQVTLEGFRTFKSKQTVNVPQGAGLYLMRGINEVDSDLAGNDVGKSTLWDAVYWGLYGETTRGLRAGQVIAWGSEHAMVEQCWDINGRSVTVCRRQSPNSLWLNGERAEQADIVEAIGLNDQEFLHSILFGQFTHYFLDLSPTDKLGLFNNVLGLSYWEERSSMAAKEADRVDREVCSLENKIKLYEGRIEEMRTHRAELEHSQDEWRKKADAEQTKYRQEVDKLQDCCQKLRGTLELQQTLLGNAEKELTTRTSVRQHFIDRLSSLDIETARLQRDIKLDRCPFCKQELDPAWREELALQLRQQRFVQEKLAESHVVAYQRCEDSAVRVLDLREDVKRLRSEFDEVNTQLGAKRAQLVETKDPYAQLLADVNTDLLTSIQERRALESKYSKACTLYQRWKYWVKGFKELRLWVLDSTLSELELRVNNSLVQLGLPDWSIRMAVERENKSGGVTKGFVVNVASPDSAEGAPWKGWGGGVTQRLRVATEIGLGRLISDRKSTDLGIEVFDEPDCHMSKSGIHDLLEHLQSRSLEENRQIWVVTHAAIDYPFDGVSTVRKTADGSRVEL